MAAAEQSATDGIRSGWCGRGMLSILKTAGLGRGLEGGNGQDWEKILTKAGWKPMRVSSPQQAPLGSVLVYMGDARVGKRLRGTRGGKFGHVEMVAIGKAGARLYVSDDARVAPGGTVRDNFTGRAWMPPGSRIATTVTVPLGDQVDQVLEDRLSMAMAQFQRKKQEVASLETAQKVQ